jgi:hypothetical protein
MAERTSTFCERMDNFRRLSIMMEYQAPPLAREIVVSAPDAAQLIRNDKYRWLLIHADDPAEIERFERELSRCREDLVDELIEQSSWKCEVEAFAGGKGTPAERLVALRAAHESCGGTPRPNVVASVNDADRRFFDRAGSGWRSGPYSSAVNSDAEVVSAAPQKAALAGQSLLAELDARYGGLDAIAEAPGKDHCGFEYEFLGVMGDGRSAAVIFRGLKLKPEHVGLCPQAGSVFWSQFYNGIVVEVAVNADYSPRVNHNSAHQANDSTGGAEQPQLLHNTLTFPVEYNTAIPSYIAKSNQGGPSPKFPSEVSSKHISKSTRDQTIKAFLDEENAFAGTLRAHEASMVADPLTPEQRRAGQRTMRELRRILPDLTSAPKPN